MTTTSHIQKIPDYFPTQEQCVQSIRNRPQTNLRYRGYNQVHFTCGDEEQFEQYRDYTNGFLCQPNIDTHMDIHLNLWSGYNNLNASYVSSTFQYMFHKFKKGIYVKIQDNQLKVFLPFSKANYTNEWSEHISYDKSRFSGLEDFFKYVNHLEGRPFNPKFVNKFVDTWFGNNCLIRYEFPIAENDSGVSQMSDMFKTLCETKQVPDIEFFLNRRDFPLLKRNLTEPYDFMYNTEIPLLSHKYEKYFPILGGAVTDDYADIPIPTWDDWARVRSYEGKYFTKSCGTYDVAHIPWEQKMDTAVFRGGSTGCGVTIDTNMRLKVAYLSSITPHENGTPLLDAGITNWNLRPRKLNDKSYLQTIEIDKLPFGLVGKLDYKQQSGYKYIINIDGHVTAFRISLEMNMGSVILLVKSKYSIWFMKKLRPYVHYVPIKEDLSDLLDQIRWCRSHDTECQEIVQNAKSFYSIYLSKDGILNYIQNTLVQLKQHMGTYIYNYKSPLQLQIQHEKKKLFTSVSFPSTNKTIENINVIPFQTRSYSLLQGVQWIYNMINLKSNGNPRYYLNISGDVFTSVHGKVQNGTLAQFPLVVKQNSNYNESIHETFIGLNGINPILQDIPNFVYTMGSYMDVDNKLFGIVLEKIDGITLFDYIKSKQFSIGKYIFIILQLCLALQVAQNKCGFIHWDLMPWNIIIQKLPKPINIDYPIAHDNIIRVETDLIPIVIDYGKSHIIHNQTHYGYIHMYKMSTIQDPLTLLLSSLYTILEQYQDLNTIPKQEQYTFIYLGNFITNTQYRKQPFRYLNKLKSFLRNAKKFSVITSSNKYELENRTPMDLYRYIMQSQYKFSNVSQTPYIEYTLNSGNAKQVFDYILSQDTDAQFQTYIDTLSDISKCDIQHSENIFFDIYTMKQIFLNVDSVFKYGLHFASIHNLNTNMFKTVYDNCIQHIISFRDKYVQYSEPNQITYSIHNIKSLDTANYTEETFLNPQEIEKITLDIQYGFEDMIEYQNKILRILSYKNQNFENKIYRIDNSLEKYYRDVFQSLLELNPVNVKTFVANNQTLKDTVNEVYKINRYYLKKQYKCKDVDILKDVYSLYV